MSITFIIILALSSLSRTECFEFFIGKDLNNAQELPESVWSHIEVLGAEGSGNDHVTVKVDIPKAVNYSDVFIFFANDTKEVLRVQLNETVNGKFYTKPHNPLKEMKAEETTTTEKGDFRQISGEFPASWLPENFSKISATVTTIEGKYYNYYGILNFLLSIPDLMVVEEYKNLR